MDARQLRGPRIAATCKINRKGDEWTVPSQNQDGTRYTVNPGPEAPTCSCPDFEQRGMKCKHTFAVEYVIERERNPDGSTTVTETVTFSETIQRKATYPQAWSAYNSAQSVEKDRVQELLFDLCQDIPEPERAGKGRKPHSVRDSIFSMVFKVYSTFSSRRFSSDLREARQRGFLSKPIPGLKVPQFMENPDFAPVLKEMIARSALPLRAVETDFAIDSSGFGSNRWERWIDEKYGVPRKKCLWVKTHIASGVKTNVVTAVRILDKDANDSPQFVPLLRETAEGFTISEVSADAAYGSVANFEAVADCGGTGYIMFKANATGAAGGMYQKMFHFFSFKRDEYLQHYHKRGNVESTFSMIKRKFGDSVRSKNDEAMVNEVLCKLVCHNLCVLIQEQHELGIEAVFRPASAGNGGLAIEGGPRL